ncbi:MAG: sel1 repeat family protein [Gammaproteobacteria bacterium]|nr:sel1 repeat family protein [Gammaproteobacteria bacterium]
MSKRNTSSALFFALLLTIAPLATRADAYDDGMDAYQAGNYQHALQLWESLAGHEHPQAHYNLGFMHEFGYGVAPDDVRAFSHYLRAAQQGHVQAQHTVAWMYQRGKGVTADREQAARWLDIAASSEKTANEIDVQEFVEQLAAELKNAGARYDAQKATQQNPPVEFEASNQIS